MLSMEVRGIGIQKYFRMACSFWNRKASSWRVNSESQICRGLDFLVNSFAFKEIMGCKQLKA